MIEIKLEQGPTARATIVSRPHTDLQTPHGKLMTEALGFINDRLNGKDVVISENNKPENDPAPIHPEVRMGLLQAELDKVRAEVAALPPKEDKVAGPEGGEKNPPARPQAPLGGGSRLIQRQAGPTGPAGAPPAATTPPPPVTKISDLQKAAESLSSSASGDTSGSGGSGSASGDTSDQGGSSSGSASGASGDTSGSGGSGSASGSQ